MAWRAGLLEASVPAWPRPVLLPSTWLMITRATESSFHVSSGIGSTVGTPIRVVTVASEWLGCCPSPPDPSQGRNMLARGSDAVERSAGWSADFGRLEGGRDETSRSPCCALSCSDLSGGQSCKKGRLDGCLLPITLPVIVRLGENAPGALNALVPVPASGGGRRPCARGLLICTSQLPYLTVAVWSSPS